MAVNCFPSTTNVAIILLLLLTSSFISVSNANCGDSCKRVSPDLVCCRGQCVYGYTCSGRSCLSDSDCSSYDSCCAKKCVVRLNCAHESCSSNSDCSVNQECCGSFCIQGSCIGRFCSLDSECSLNQTCCNNECAKGNNCLGRHCSLNSDCSNGQACCNSKCKSGSDCIGESCSIASDCQVLESCCGGTCERDCVSQLAILPYIVVPAGALVNFLIVCAIFIYCRRRRRRLLMGANPATNMTTVITRGDGIQVLTEQISTNNPAAPVTQCNPLYQPEGPPSDQPTEQTSFAAAPYKPAGVA